MASRHAEQHVFADPGAPAPDATRPDFYFSRFEHRRPPEPLKRSPVGERVWQVLAVLSLMLGARYIIWR